jgi:hypothetical protein
MNDVRFPIGEHNPEMDILEAILHTKHRYLDLAVEVDKYIPEIRQKVMEVVGMLRELFPDCPMQVREMTPTRWTIILKSSEEDAEKFEDIWQERFRSRENQQEPTIRAYVQFVDVSGLNVRGYPL